ncbi:MAG: hypothetical protein OXI61_02310 [Candidatus Poribacteria bacterium]|nr:hypothetical protein [Candidatus Poribacteria bacterium]
MNFIEAIQNSPEIAICLENGLQALERRDKNKVNMNSSRDLKGSVYIDKCLERRYPNSPRWDYVFGYKDQIYYVEVHPADNTRKVREVTAKLRWLKQWRGGSAQSLEDLERQSTYHWISTGRTASSVKRGRYLQILAQNGIRGPDSVLNVDTVR